MSEARIISLWQPWASAVALGLKQYETRSWHTDYRGTLVIHAAKNCPKPCEMEALKKDMAEIGKEKELKNLLETIESPEVYGAIVAVCELKWCKFMIDGELQWCKMMNRSTHHQEFSKLKEPSFLADHILIEEVSPMERVLGDWSEGRFAWKLENVQAIAPIPWKGAQGLRKFDLEVLQSNRK